MTTASPLVTLVPARGAAPPERNGATVFVTDTSWTPGPGERADIRSIRPVIADAIERTDMFADALARIEAWADASDIAARAVVDGVSVWHAIREPLWSWLHERLLWAHVLTQLGAGTAVIEAGGVDEAAVRDVLGLPPPSLAAPVASARSATTAPRRLAARVRRRTRVLLAAALLRTPAASRSPSPSAAELDARIRRLADIRRGGVLVLSYGRVAQVVQGAGAARLADPHLAAVIDRLEADGLRPVVLALALDHTDTRVHSMLREDGRVLPDWLLSSRWGSNESAAAPPETGAAAADEAAADAIRARVAAIPALPIRVGPFDLGPALHAEGARLAAAAASAHVTTRDRAGRLLDELGPAAVLMTLEGLRAPWLDAAARRNIRVFALQHGVIYPGHPGYRRRRDPGLLLPSRTFVFGDYERRTLIEHGGYREDEVEVTGAPRLELTPEPGERTCDREAVRAELGVAEDTMLVISTVHVPYLRHAYLATMIDRILGAALPGVHLVFKQHPGERDEGPYRALLAGLAAARGFPVPPTSVVREIDLLRLLRAADGHLGLFSTVLTDAVVAGTRNLVARIGRDVGPLDYVGAGVARPVDDPADLRRALLDPNGPDEAARQAFLADHFRPGDATGRIVAAVAEAVGARGGRA